MKRLRLEIAGAVQGVGFRPFIFRLASRYRLPGWVTNTSSGVTVEVEGRREELEAFREAVRSESPPLSIITEFGFEYLEPAGFSGFEIRESTGGRREVLVLPDMATCPQCAAEIRDSSDRRFRYPFTNCTNCGPRYSIINALPYDRPYTSMKSFEMCPECRREYSDPMDRRFHAQPNACPVCGPHLEFWDPSGKTLSLRNDALMDAAEAILEGRIVAVKGLGGFHLIVRSDSDDAVLALRRRKGRMRKPFALMFPDLQTIRSVCQFSQLEAASLTSPRAPIVLLRKRDGDLSASVSALVSPDNPELGIMLPYTPLHTLLMREVGLPVVATSGNLTDEPICTDEHEALNRLNGIADLFLVHDRPIVRHVDDSIVRIFRGGEMVIRRARGYAPLPVRMSSPGGTVLATGAHLKNTLALSIGSNVFVSQHIGDLETPQALSAFDEVLGSIKDLYDVEPEMAACDMHPDYASSSRARDTGLRVIPVQHHVAHVYSCMLDRSVDPPLLGVAWDGTGYGTDGTVWGGEFFHVTEDGCRRIARLRQFPLPGGDRAVKEPRRSALGLLWKMGIEPFQHLPESVFPVGERGPLLRMMERGLNSPLTSSAGRLFDAVASLLGLCQRNEFEAQAAMALQHSIRDASEAGHYPFRLLNKADLTVIDWAPMIEEILEEFSMGLNTGTISAKFHITLSRMILEVAESVGEEKVLLSGGCFQNSRLLQLTCDLLEDSGFDPVTHSGIPANDGGIAPGQVFAAITGK